MRHRPLPANHSGQQEIGYELSDNIDPLTQPLGVTNPELRDALWHALTGETEAVGNLTKGTDAYFNHYAKIIGESAYKAPSIKTHLQLINIVQDLRSSTPREVIVSRLTHSAQDGSSSSQQSPSAASDAGDVPSMDVDAAEHAVCLATRVLSMSGLAEPPNTFTSCHTHPWSKGCLSDRLKEQHKICLIKDVFLNYDAEKLERMARLKIEFTDELNQHLYLLQAEEEAPSTLFVFHHVRYLEAMQQEPGGQLFPPLFLQETVQTLNLLFPPYNNRVQNRFFKRVEKDDSIDELVLKCSNGEIGIKSSSSAYPYWGTKLVELNRVLAEAEPATLWEAFLDPRPGLRVPIMLALIALILTAFFGLAQSIEGGIQVYKAYEPSAGP